MKSIAGQCFIFVSTVCLWGCGSEGDSPQKNNISVLYSTSQTTIYLNEPVLIQAISPSSMSTNNLNYKWELVSSPNSDNFIAENDNENLLFKSDIPGIYSFNLKISNSNKTASGIVHIPILDPAIEFDCSTHTPQGLSIFVQNNQNILKETYQNSLITQKHDHLTTQFQSEIRGRGNSTWDAVKKPYRLKIFKSDQFELLGMPKDRNWALLANAYDGSGLRNALALCLGQNVMRSWTPQYRFVNLELNGVAQGLYLVTQHVETANHKVNLSGPATLEDQFVDDLSFFIELTPTERLNSSDVYILSQQGNYYEVKSELPENVHQKNLLLKQITEYINSFEHALASNHFNQDLDYTNYLDLDQSIDYLLINELFKDYDRFWSSTHFFKAKNEKMKFGPIWDYDLSSGNYAGYHNAEGWLVLQRTIPVQMQKHPLFKEKLFENWVNIYKKIPHLINYLKREAQNIDEAQMVNQKIWPLNPYSHSFSNSKQNYIGTTQREHVEFLKDWIVQRAEWINNNIHLIP